MDNRQPSNEAESPYNIKLEAFEGPLDLLLHLIKKNELDIYDIPISTISRQYLEYIKLMKELNLEIAGEFLVMAATLIQIKSKLLLPPTEDEETAEEEAEDPRAELIRRLLEYQKFKDAAALLENMTVLGRDTFARDFVAPELQAFQPEDEALEVGLYELIEAFQRVLAKVPVESFHEVAAESLSIADRISEILALLQGQDAVPFDDLFNEPISRECIIITFLSILELCRLKMVRVVQNSRCGAIWITLTVLTADGNDAMEDAFGYSKS